MAGEVVLPSLPVVGDATVEKTKLSFQERYKEGVDANFSIKGDNGSIANVSANQELTLGLGAARMGANAWMQSGADEGKYKNVREPFMKIMQAGKVAAIASLNAPLIKFYESQMINFDKGAATAKGLNLNSDNTSNRATFNRAMAKKATNGDLVNTTKQQLAPTFGSSKLQAVGYSQAQQQRTGATQRR
jgi:hypothetical protein